MSIACSDLFQALAVSEDDRKSERATSGISCERDPGVKRRGLPLSLTDPARRPPAFSIVLTDRDPGTGYIEHYLSILAAFYRKIIFFPQNIEIKVIFYQKMKT